MRRYGRIPGLHDSILDPGFVRRTGLAARAQALLAGRLRPASTRQAHWLRLTDGLLPLTLELADKAAHAFALEPRYPFFDRRLVEFCVALPPDQKLDQGWTRVVMRRAMAGILPEEVRWRGGKTHLAPSFHRGLSLVNRGFLDDVMEGNLSDIAAYVDVDALRQSYRRCVVHAGADDELAVWKSVMLALWVRRMNSEVGSRESGTPIDTIAMLSEHRKHTPAGDWQRPTQW